MLKNVSKLGSKISKDEQKKINGGRGGKLPELCSSEEIVVCYPPMKCAQRPDGSSYCIR